MFAIFTTSEQDAQNCANDIQSWLTANRPGYNALQWDVPYQHPDLSEWAIALPPAVRPEARARTDR